MIGDAVVHDAGPEHTRIFAEWSAGMQRHGITADGAAAHFAQGAEEDRSLPLRTELGLLPDAGFQHPDCFWKQSAIAVYGGSRGA